MRKLTIILALILTLFAMEVYALGVSHIRVSSKLNEPFNAKLDISSIPKTSRSSIQVRLASATDFKRAGLDRLYVLTKLQFTIQTVSQNKAVVHITTEQTITEPFLNFLVEVKWIGGRMLREYTVLLDPPLYKDTVSAPFQPVRKSPRKTVRVSRTTEKPFISGDPYTISRRDSLWKIAKRTRPSGVSIREHMRRIYNANPHAFIGGKKTLIKAGKVIHIPGWTNQGRSPRRTRRAPDNFRTPSATTPNVGPRLVITRPTAPVEPPAGRSNRAEIEKLQKQIRKISASNTRITLKNEDLKKDVLKNRDLVVTMKKQLDELHKNLTLQNKRMAELQSQLTEQRRDNQELKNKIAKLSESASVRSASATDKTQLVPAAPPPQPDVPVRVAVTPPQPATKDKNDQATTPVPYIHLILSEVASNLDIQVQKEVSQQLQANPSLKDKMAAFPIFLAQTSNVKVAPLDLSPKQLADLQNKLEIQIELQLGNKPDLISRITEEFYGSPDKIAKLMTESVIVQFKKGTPKEIAKLVKSLGIDISKPASLVETANLVTDLKQGSLNEFIKMMAKSKVAQLQAKSPEEMAQFVDKSDEDLVRKAKVLLKQAMDNWIIVILALVGGILILFLVRLKKNKLSILPRNLALPKSMKKEMNVQTGPRYLGNQESNEIYKQVFLDEVRRINNEEETESEFKPSQAAITQNVASIPEGDEELREEVELYKAYERYDKAEELLREAIEQYPDYPEYRFKLLEIHTAVNDVDKFKEDAALLYNAVNGKGSLWNKTLELWESLAPNQVLLSPENLTFPTTIEDKTEEPNFKELLEKELLLEKATRTGSDDDLQGMELPPITTNQASSNISGSNQSDDLGEDFNFDDETGKVKIVEKGVEPEANKETETTEFSLDDDLLFEDSGTAKLDTGNQSEFDLVDELSSDKVELSLDESEFSLDSGNDKTNGLSFEDELSSSLDTTDLSLDTGNQGEFDLEEELSSLNSADQKNSGLSLEEELSAVEEDEVGASDGTVFLVEKETVIEDNQETLNDNSLTDSLSLEDELSLLESVDQKDSELSSGLSLDEELLAVEEDEIGASDGTVSLVEKETLTDDKLEETTLEDNETDDLFSLKDENDSTATKDLSLEDELSWLNDDSSFDKSKDTDIAEGLSSVDDLLNDDLSLSNDTESKALLEDDEFDFSTLNSDKKSQNSEMSSLFDDDVDLSTNEKSDDLDDLLSQLDTEEMSELEGNPLNGQFDLAQMYIDMDDNESARKILEELLESSNGEERRLAQKMIAALA